MELMARGPGSINSLTAYCSLSPGLTAKGQPCCAIQRSATCATLVLWDVAMATCSDHRGGECEQLDPRMGIPH